MKILVVEDDPIVGQSLKLLLASRAYIVDLAIDGKIGWEMVHAFVYDLIVLDVILPELDGITLCQQLRAQGKRMPILLLTGQEGAQQKADALNSGADDYVVKPFDAEELLARVQALLRRGDTVALPQLTWGRLCVEPSSHKVTYGTELVSLTAKEYAILELLLYNPQTTYSNQMLLDQVWESTAAPDQTVVRFHIKELRRKLSAVGAPKNFIKTIHGVGYRLNPLYSAALTEQADESLTKPQIAELKAVNEELRTVLEQLQSTQTELEQKYEELEIAYQTIEHDRQQLQASETRINQILNHASASIVSMRVFADRTWQYDYYSAGCERVFGYTPTEMMSDRWWSSIPTEDRESVLLPALDGIFAERPVHLEYRFRHKDGTLRWISSDLSSYRDDQHDCWRVIAIDIDISERKQLEADHQQTETALHAQEEDFHATFNLTNVGMVQIDINTHQILRVNDALCALTGYTEAELLNLTVNDLNHPDDRERDREKLNNLIHGKASTYHVEKRYLRKDGSSVWVLAIGNIIRDEAGQPLRVMKVIQDISDLKWSETERQQAEAALRESEARFRNFAENSQAVLWIVRPVSFETLYVNPAYEQIWGRSRQELIAQPHSWIETVHPDDRDWVMDARQQHLHERRPEGIEYRIVRPDGSIRWIWDWGFAIGDEAGKVYSIGGIAEDITERKQIELTLQQQIAEAQLIADISQDIRQSLDLNSVLSRTVERVRALLNTDRVIIFRFRPDWQGDVIMESVGADWLPILSTTIFDPCFTEKYIEPYRQGRVSTVADLEQAGLEPCYVEMLRPFQVKAILVVPILQGEDLWGLLIAHHCSAPRQWQPTEVDLLQKLANQVSIAIQQSELYERTQRELSARKQMQTVLEESEERFRTLSTSAPIGICQTNADGICLYCNTCWQEMSGLSLEDSIGNGWLQAIHPDDRATFSAAWEACLQGTVQDLPEFRLQPRQGDIRWVSARVAAIQSARGETIGYVSTYEDITERKQAEQALRESEQRFQTILDNSPAVIYLLDDQNRHLLVNRSYADLLSTTPALLIGQSIYEVWPPEIADVFAKNNRQVFATGELLQIEEMAPQVDGIHTYITVKFPLRDGSGVPYALCGISTDITEKKQLEAQFYRAQRLESLGTLASGIAHDLNNILTPILTIAQLISLKQPNLDQKSQEMLQILESSAKRGSDMVKQIMTFARGTEGKRIPLQVAYLLQDIVKVSRQTFPKSIKIDKALPEQPLSLVSADPTQLHQVLMNLCVNARDAMPDGGTLTLSAQNCTVDQKLAKKNLDARVGNYVLITISDTGTGIPNELRDRIFDPFFTTKELGKGTGLGLSTSLGIIKSYGGFLQIVSEVGKGTQISIYLPVSEGSPTQSKESPALQEGQGELILIVDDDLAVQSANQSLLESYGYKTLIANDGQEAIDLYNHYQDEIRLILLDVMMPNLDGIATIPRLKQTSPQAKIIAVSGLLSNKEVVLAAGADLFLVKPYSVNDLIQKIYELIGDD